MPVAASRSRWPEGSHEDQLGIVRWVRANPLPSYFPLSYRLFTAALCDTTLWSDWPVDASGAGYAFGADDRARRAAVGEAFERYCGGLVPPGLVRTRHAHLPSAIDPATLALFSPDQYASPGFPFVAFDSTLDVDWTAGRDLRSGARVHVPASVVWVSHPHAVLPRTNPIVQAGLAAGPDRAFAEWSALCEVVERDTMTVVWHGGGRLRSVDPPSRLRRLARGPLRCRFLAFPNDLGLLVVGALVDDTETGYLTLGMGCGTDPEAVLLKAYGEALQLQHFVAAYDDPEGGYMRAARNPASPLRPWRSDRAYARDYAHDLSDVVDYGCHLQLYLDPAVQRRFESELADAIDGEVGWGELRAEVRTAEELVDRLAGQGFRAISVDVTTPDAAASGFSVVRVVVPGLYSNSAAGLPFLGGRIGPWSRRLPLPH